jgi:nucleoside-diphosphate-sugar epimerase
MKVFVTGATGYVGSGIAAALVAAGHQVSGLSRSAEKDAALAQAGVRPLRGALGNVKALARELQGFDALVHAAVDYGLGPAADREAIEALLEAARSAPGMAAVVYTSGVWVLGEAREPVSESASTAHPFAAVAWRPAHEQLVLSAASQRLASAVVRPGVVFGERRGLLVPWYESAVKEGRTAFVGPGSQRWPFVHQRDLGELYRMVVERRASGIFHGVDGASPTVESAAAAVSRAAGKGGATRSIPVEEARKAMGPMADALAGDQVVVSRRAAEVGWTPRHPPFAQDAASALKEWRGT